MCATGRKQAKWWKSEQNDALICLLCPRYCKIGEGKKGLCTIRVNESGVLYQDGYGRPTGFAVDPIEKKPLNHFFPGSSILSFGTAGCNLACKFCQNWTMSKAESAGRAALYVTPREVVSLAKKHDAPSIAFTYNDPIIFAEYVIDIAKLAKKENIHSVMVTNGYISREARAEVFKNIDAANVDLKAFTENFYQRFTASQLQPVLDNLIWLKNESDVWIEITTLLIPGENDSPEELKQMVSWILENLGDQTPLHFTAFHPDFKMTDYSPTPRASLNNARLIAKAGGIKYCYTGNINDPKGQTTYCPRCGTALIERNWHSVSINKVENNHCPVCNTKIAGLFS